MKTDLPAGRDAVTKLSAMIIATVFACLIVIQAYVSWKSLRQIEASNTAKAVPASSTNQDTLDAGRLAATHLFGDIAKAVPQDSEVKEDKSLNLTLRGIVANSGGNTSLAIIESKPYGEETFALGDTVFNRGKLNSIAVDHVILIRNDGRLARLQLPEPESIETANEDYLPQPQSQPAYVEPVYAEPETPAPEPAIAVQPEPESENQDQNQADTQAETPPETPPDETTSDNQNTTPAQP